MKVIPLVVGACLFTTGALAQSVPEMQKMADEWPAAFNKGDTATVANFYKDDAVVFPPGGDMVKGKQAIQSFWTEAAKGIQADHFKVTDVRSLGPDTAREQGYACLRLRATTHRRWLASMWSFGKRSVENGSSNSDIWNLNKPE